MTVSAAAADQFRRRNARIRQVLLVRRAPVYGAGDQVLYEDTLLGGSALEILDAAAALAVPPPRDGTEADTQIKPVHGTASMFSQLDPCLAHRILVALAAAWGRDKRCWPDLITIRELRGALRAGGLSAGPVPRL